MAGVQPCKELHPLCHEHHVNMRRTEIALMIEGEHTPTPAYACPVTDCLVHYSMSRGYFVLSQNGNTNELDTVPRVRCSHDGTPMYLAEIDRERRGFRLWRCPQCDGRRTNEEGLVGLASQEIHSVKGKNGVEP